MGANRFRWRAVRTAAGAVARLRRTFPQTPGLRILMYHAIGSRAAGDRQDRYSIPPNVFASQMHWLADHWRDRIVSLDAARQDKPGIAVTFDDGYADNLERAAPILENLGIPFTVFATGSYVRSGGRLYLSPAGLRDLSRIPGATIGAHSDTHCRLTACDDAALGNELGGTRRWLEDLLGMAVVTLSYPHGDWNERVVRAVKAHGYEMAASSHFGLNTKPYDKWALKRTDIWSDDNESTFSQKLEGAWDWIGWRLR